MQNNIKSLLVKRQLLIPLLLLLIVVSGMLLYLNRYQASEQKPGDTSMPGVEKIDLSPPTEQEKQATAQHKEDLIKQEQARNQPPGTTPITVTPIITNSGFYDGQAEVSAFVPGIYEDTGICSAIFTQGTAKVTREAPALKDATTTRCVNFNIPRSAFPSTGLWSVVISYSSPTANGNSESKNLEVR